MANRRQVLIGFAGISLGSLFGYSSSAQSTVSAFDYFIGPDGSDANPGTSASPWAITALSGKPVIAGKRVGLLDGTYVVRGIGTGNGGYIIGVPHSGSIVAPTVVAAVNPRRVVITTNDAGVYPQTTAAVVGVTGDFVTIRDIRFQQLASGAIQVSGSNVVVEGCEIFDIDLRRYTSYAATYPGDNVGGIRTILNGHDLTVRDCRIEKVRNGTVGSHNAAGLGPFFSYENIIIENCTVLDAVAGVYFKSTVSGLTVRNCYFGSGVVKGILGGGRRHSTKAVAWNRIQHNIFNRVAQIVAGGECDTAADVEFSSNTVIPADDAAYYSALVNFDNPMGPAAAYQVKLFNNLFYFPIDSSVRDVRFLANSAPAPQVLVQIDYNGYRSTGFSVEDQTVGGSVYTSLAAWRGRTGKDVSSVQISSPSFVNSAGTSPQDFRLLASSPAKVAGRVGGVSSGSSTELGAWGDGVSEIGHVWAARPLPPSVSVS